jgi:hypothetical protein
MVSISAGPAAMVAEASWGEPENSRSFRITFT